jgi:putative hydrolase of the HAD superfamily
LRTILCDLGNVLLFFCHERMCRQIGSLCGLTAQQIRTHLLDSTLQWDFERGRISEDQLHARLEELIGSELERTALRKAAGDIFELNQPMIPVLKSLKEQGLRLVLLSNTCVTHIDWVRRNFSVLDEFDHLVLSYEAGAIKPEEGIYRAALAAIHCDPQECLYVDDVPAYVVRGQEFGLQAEVFTGVEDLLRQLGVRGVHVNASSTLHCD